MTYAIICDSPLGKKKKHIFPLYIYLAKSEQIWKTVRNQVLIFTVTHNNFTINMIISILLVQNWKFRDFKEKFA